MYNRISVLLSKNQKIGFIVFFFSMFLSSALEIIAIGALSGMVYVLSSFDTAHTLLQKYGFINFIQLSPDLVNSNFFLPAILLVIFLTKAIVTFIINFFEAKLYSNINTTNTKRLFNFFLKSSYKFHLNTSPAKIINNCLGEINRTNIFLISMLSFIKDIIFLIFITVTCFFVDFYATTIIFFTMFVVTLVFFFSLEKNLKRRGGLIINVQKNATNLITQCLNGIKYIKLANIENKVTDILGKFVNSRNEQNAIKTFLSKTPKVFLEFFSVIVMIFVIFSLLNRGQEFSGIVPLLSFYVLVIIRLIPVFNNLNISFTNYKYCEKSFLNITNYLSDAIKLKKKILKTDGNTKNKKNLIELENISFEHNSGKQILKNISLSIPFKKKIGIYGPSGSGKTTIADLLMGFLPPTLGIKRFNKNFDKSKIGYITQETFLLNDSIKNNIIFSYQQKKYNNKKLQFAIKNSFLDDYINNLTENINSKIGDQGAKMSGGQRQRLGLARLFYGDYKFIILDEATSAMDKKLENKIFDNIYKLKEVTAIIISHNFDILKRCDTIYLIKDGKLDDFGTPNYLLSKYKLK